MLCYYYLEESSTEEWTLTVRCREPLTIGDLAHVAELAQRHQPLAAVVLRYNSAGLAETLATEGPVVIIEDDSFFEEAPGD